MDRNFITSWNTSGIYVALLAEGVDRNKQQGGTWRYAGVALLAEGVDRNVLLLVTKFV